MTTEPPGDPAAPGTGHRTPSLLADHRAHAALLLLLVLAVVTYAHPLIGLGLTAVTASLALAWYLAAPVGRPTQYRPAHRHSRN